MLGPKDQKLLNDTLSKAQGAADERKNARAEFEKGEQARQDGRPGEALQHYRAASENRYADDGTRAKAREQMSLAEADMKRYVEDLKGVYASAVDDYKAGRYPEAKAKFERLRDAGFKPGFFQKSVAEYLNDVDAQIARSSPPPPPEPAPAQQPAPAPGPAEVANQPPPSPAQPEQPAPTPQPAPAEVAQHVLSFPRCVVQKLTSNRGTLPLGPFWAAPLQVDFPHAAGPAAYDESERGHKNRDHSGTVKISS